MANENENEKRKTVTDILAEYRNDADAMDRGGLYQPTAEYVRRLLDRIEAAWKREREELERYAASKMLDGATIVDNRKVGNAAAVREALVEMVSADTDGDMTLDSLCGRCIDKLHGTCKHDGSCWCEKVIAALAAPARNCDELSADDVKSRFKDRMASSDMGLIGENIVEVVSGVVDFLYATKKGGAE